MDLQIHHHTIDDVDVLTVVGEVDMYSATQLREQLSAATADPGHLVVLELSGVAFMDSVGLGVLAGASRRSRTRAGQLRLASLQSPVRQVMTITGLIKEFHTYPDAPAAVRG